MTVQSVPGVQTVKSWPGTREIHVAGSQIYVTSLPDDGKGFPHPWTYHALECPNALTADDFTVLGAIAREWTVDLLVRLKPAVDGDPVQVWRLSPIRVRGVASVVVQHKDGTRRPAMKARRVTACTSPPSPDLGFAMEVDHDHLTFDFWLPPEPWSTQMVLAQHPSGTRPKELTYDYFISYKARDHEVTDVAGDIARTLGTTDRVWYAPDVLVSEPEFVKPIVAGIERSRILIVLWTDHSHEYVTSESALSWEATDVEYGGGEVVGSSRSRPELNKPSEEEMRVGAESYAPGDPYNSRGLLKMNQFWEIRQILVQLREEKKTVFLYDLRSDKSRQDPLTDPARALGMIMDNAVSRINILQGGQGNRKLSVDNLCQRVMTEARAQRRVAR